MINNEASLKHNFFMILGHFSFLGQRGGVKKFQMRREGAKIFWHVLRGGGQKLRRSIVSDFLRGQIVQYVLKKGGMCGTGQLTIWIFYNHNKEFNIGPIYGGAWTEKGGPKFKWSQYIYRGFLANNKKFWSPTRTINQNFGTLSCYPVESYKIYALGWPVF